MNGSSSSCLRGELGSDAEEMRRTFCILYVPVNLSALNPIPDPVMTEVLPSPSSVKQRKQMDMDAELRTRLVHCLRLAQWRLHKLSGLLLYCISLVVFVSFRFRNPDSDQNSDSSKKVSAKVFLLFSNLFLLELEFAGTFVGKISGHFWFRLNQEPLCHSSSC